MPDNIYLTGLSGSGKTTVAPIVAKMLGYRAVDADAAIVRDTGRSIARIFADDGEAAFREIERVAVERIARERNVVVALGGGAVVTDSTRELLRSTGIIVHLDASVSTLVRRLRSTRDRPLLADGVRERLQALADERAPLYACASFTVKTDGRPPRDVAREIVDTLATRTGVVAP